MDSTRRLQQLSNLPSQQLCRQCIDLTTNADLCNIIRGDGKPWDVGIRMPRKYTDKYDLPPQWYLLCQSSRTQSSRQTISSASVDTVIREVLSDDQSIFRDVHYKFDSVSQDVRPFEHCKRRPLSNALATDCYLCRKLRCFKSASRPGGPGKAASDSENGVCMVKRWSRYRSVSGASNDPETCGVAIYIVYPSKNPGSRARNESSLLLDRDITHLCGPQVLAYGLYVAPLFAQIETWLTDCRTSHSCLPEQRNASNLQRVTPRRLIKILAKGEGPRVRLVETVPRGTTYGTLSYQWGRQGVPQKLVESNHANYRKDIPLALLPRTFQDAVFFMNKIEVKYIWIDALCIIQDSDDDWLSEAPKMIDIYGGSFINLAATASGDAEGGLFVQPELRPWTGVSLGWKSILHQPSVFAEHGVSWRYNHQIEQSPLSRRGWVFQEQFLAPRTIHFAEDQIWFECREECATEVCSIPREECRDHPPLRDFLAKNWKNLVAQYSRRYLTYKSDIFVAFSGVAEAFGRACGYHPSEYCAGFWQARLQSELLWFVISPLDATRHPITSYVAPSWSRAGQPHAVMWTRSDEISDEEWHPAFKILGVSLSLKTKSYFGPVSNGSLEVTCYLHPVKLTHDTATIEPLLIISG